MQQMHPEEQRNYQGYEGNQAYEQQRSGTGYGPDALYDDEFVDAFAQRLSQRMAQGPAGKIQPPKGRGASAGQRLALAIVSVSVLGFLGLILFTVPVAQSLVGLLVLGLVTLAMILINIVFNVIN
jgi:hypothetical protein